MKSTPIGLVFVLGAIVGGLVVIAGFAAGRAHARHGDTLTTPAIVDDGERVLKRAHVYEITCAGGGATSVDRVRP